MTEEPIKSLAARTLSDDTADHEEKRLAAYVLGDADNERTANQSASSALSSHPQEETAMNDPRKPDQRHQGEYTTKNPDAEENVRMRKQDEDNRAHNIAEARRQQEAHDNARVGVDGEITDEEAKSVDADKKAK